MIYVTLIIILHSFGTICALPIPIHQQGESLLLHTSQLYIIQWKLLHFTPFACVLVYFIKNPAVYC